MKRCNYWYQEDILKLKELASVGSSMLTLKKEFGRSENYRC